MEPYRVKESTDGKFIGKSVEFTPPPLMIGEHEFFYEKVVVSGDSLILSNSNYVILISQ